MRWASISGAPDRVRRTALLVEGGDGGPRARVVRVFEPPPEGGPRARGRWVQHVVLLSGRPADARVRWWLPEPLPDLPMDGE